MSLTGLEVLAVDREKVRTEFCKIYLAKNAKAKRESLETARSSIDPAEHAAGP